MFLKHTHAHAQPKTVSLAHTQSQALLHIRERTREGGREREKEREGRREGGREEREKKRERCSLVFLLYIIMM